MIIRICVVHFYSRKTTDRRTKLFPEQRCTLEIHFDELKRGGYGKSKPKVTASSIIIIPPPTFLPEFGGVFEALLKIDSLPHSVQVPCKDLVECGNHDHQKEWFLTPFVLLIIFFLHLLPCFLGHFRCVFVGSDFFVCYFL